VPAPRRSSSRGTSSSPVSPTGAPPFGAPRDARRTLVDRFPLSRSDAACYAARVEGDRGGAGGGRGGAHPPRPVPRRGLSRTARALDRLRAVPAPDAHRRGAVRRRPAAPVVL